MEQDFSPCTEATTPVAWTQIESAVKPPRNLVDLLRRQAERWDTKVAFQFVHDSQTPLKTTVSYRELWTRAKAIAAELQGRLSPGERVLMAYPPGLEFIEAFFGCLLASVIPVPIAAPTRRRPQAQWEPICLSARPRLLLTATDLGAGQDWDELLGAARPQFDCLPDRAWLATDTIPSSQAQDWHPVTLDRDSLAFLQFTSGSTSAPKGVMVSHANLLTNLGQIQRAFGTSHNSRGVFWLPLHHDMGLIGGVLQPLFCGGFATLLAPAAFLQRPLLWLELISQTRASISGAPDFAYDLCARRSTAEQRSQLDLSCWEVAFTGAERIRATTVERFNAAFQEHGFRSTSWFPCYGLAESTLMVAGGPRGQEPLVVQVDSAALLNHQAVLSSGEPSRTLVGSGVVLSPPDLLIVDPDRCEQLADEQMGEIWLSGPSVAAGYYAQEVATSSAFGARLSDGTRSSYLRTGDLGFLHRGQLFVTGRRKDVIILRGRNHYPDDLEQSLADAHPALRTGGCVAFAHESDEGERLVIVHELEPRQRTVESEEICAAIRRSIAAHHELEIDTIVLTKAGQIPRTSSGKPRRSACRDLLARGELQEVAVWRLERRVAAASVAAETASPAAPPLAATEEQIRDWLRQRIAARLGRREQEIPGQTPFMEFGMGSLDAVELASDLERWLNRRLSPTAIYNHPNIDALAKWLRTTSQPTVAGAPRSTSPAATASSPAATAPFVESGTTSAAVAISAASAANLRSDAAMLDEVRQSTDDELAAFIAESMAKFSDQETPS
jgi:acyl-CoA synthetase (AMP-forming)/AMP-acid ligase II/acyl carrier protein